MDECPLDILSAVEYLLNSNSVWRVTVSIQRRVRSLLVM